MVDNLQQKSNNLPNCIDVRLLNGEVRPHVTDQWPDIFHMYLLTSIDERENVYVGRAINRSHRADSCHEARTE